MTFISSRVDKSLLGAASAPPDKANGHGGCVVKGHRQRLSAGQQLIRLVQFHGDAQLQALVALMSRAESISSLARCTPRMRGSVFNASQSGTRLTRRKVMENPLAQ